MLLIINKTKIYHIVQVCVYYYNFPTLSSAWHYSKEINASKTKN